MWEYSHLKKHSKLVKQIRAVARNFFRRGLLCKLEVLQKETLNHAYVLPGKNCGGGSNAQTPPPRYVHEANIWDCIVQFDFCYSLLHYFTEA